MTPEKYLPDPRQYEDKAWLYEQYWGELRPVREIADDCNVGHAAVREQMVEFGIPRRGGNYTRENTVSPFAGFYHDAAARTDEQSRQHFDPEHESQQRDPTDFEWSFTDYGGRA